MTKENHRHLNSRGCINNSNLNNICNCIVPGEIVNITTQTGYIVSGTVAAVNTSKIVLAVGTTITRPGIVTPIVSTRPVVLCCTSIQFLTP